MKALLGFFFVAFFLPSLAWSYPQFIGHGYTTCLPCHYSPTGGGALNDYGRALFAVEIAQKPFWMSKASDEKLSENSGFLGPVKLPFWIRPGIKYRRLFLQVNPGSKGTSAKADYPMQLDLNLNVFFNRNLTSGIIATLAHLHRPQYAYPNKPISSDMEDFAMREYFYRQGLPNGDWISVGFMDKPFGLKHVDHTSYNRTTLPLAQNDQVHGIQYSFYRKKHEAHVMLYGGNMHLPGTDQHPGVSALYEFQPIEKIRYGASALVQDGGSGAENIYGISSHLKLGLNDHSSWLAELGSKYQTEWSPYLLSIFSYNLIRGLYLEPGLQVSQNKLTTDGSISTRPSLGVVYFPFQRLELRANAYYITSRQSNTVGSDAWVTQTQLHLSF